MQKRATAAEQGRRDALYTALTALREKVNFVHDGRDRQSKAIRQAFGAGQDFVRTSTESLRRASLAIEQGYAGAPDVRTAAKAAGISSARIQELASLREAMTAEGTTQSEVARQKLGATVTRTLYLRELATMKTRLLSAARLVFKGNAAVLAEFLGKKPAPAPTKKRAKKKAKPAPTTTTGAPSKTPTS
jgi:hypothetical protein